MKKNKFRSRITIGVICVVICVLNCMYVLAEESIKSGLTYIHGDSSVCNDCQPLAVEVRGGLTYHRMLSSGTGFVDLADGTSYIVGGAAWQCSNCNLVMVTEGDYYNGTMTTIGKWATLPFDEKISLNGVIIDTPANYGVCNSSTMNGYKFFLQ